MSVRGLRRVRLAAAAVVTLVVAGALAGGSTAREARPYENADLPVRARVSDLLSRMTLEEKVGQIDPDRARLGVRRRQSDHDMEGRQRPVRRRLRAHAQHAEGMGRHGGPLPESGARHAAPHPDRLRDRLGPRRRQHARRDGLPPQHRAGRNARPRAGAEGRARDRRGDARQRSAVDVRAVRVRGARRPLGQDLRELRRGSAAGGSVREGDRRIPGTAGPPGRPRPRAGHGQALRRRR